MVIEDRKLGAELIILKEIDQKLTMSLLELKKYINNNKEDK